MSERRWPKNPKQILSLAVLLLPMLLGILAFFWFQNRLYDRIAGQSLGYIGQSALESARRDGFVLEAFLILIFIAYIVILIAFFRHQEKNLQQEMAGATADLKYMFEEERRQWALTDFLSEIYISIYQVELSTLRYRSLKKTDEMASDFPQSGNAVEAREHYIRDYLKPEFRKDFKAFMDFTTLQVRLDFSGTVSQEFQRMDDSWIRGIFAPAERDENSKLISVILAFSVINREKDKELSMQAALRNAFASARQANQAKTVFLSNMSHEMRTPLNIIMGMTKIAGASLQDGEKVSECLKKIDSSSQHLLDLINEVLDISKIESNNLELDEAEFDLSDVVEYMTNINQGLIAQKDHTLILSIHDIVHEKLIGDQARLQDVLANLLNNAATYTPNGGHIKFELMELPEKENRCWFEASFMDDGIGIGQEDIARIFEPYAHVAGEQPDRKDGLGLGLPISRNIIRMMNGDITVESVLGRGSKFTATFSVKCADIGAATCDLRFSGLSVLVTDEDPGTLRRSREIIEGLGMKCEQAASMEETLRKIREKRASGADYNAVILDWSLAGADGAEAVREASDGVSSVIACAYDCSEIDEEARGCGVTLFLNKPLFRSRVSQVFEEYLGLVPIGANRTLREKMTQYDFSGKRALLVEDNELNREIAVEILSMTGLVVETAENGKEGVDMVAASPVGWYDIILMDIQMPVMDGHEAARAIRTLNRPDTRQMPIVAMSANTFTSDVQESLKSGMNGHVAKPLDLDELQKILCRHLEDQGTEWKSIAD